MAESVYPKLREYLNARSTPAENGCRIWRDLPAHKYGYARWGGKPLRVNRLSWMASNGPIPVGMEVCHKCDVCSCIEPSHLWIGTHAENMADRNRKKRQSAGERHRRAIINSGCSASRPGAGNGNAKLSEGDIRAIRADTRHQKVIASQYGLRQATVSDIKTRKAWPHVY